MTRRTKALCAALLLTAGFGFAGWVYLHRDKVTQANFDKIGEGMSMDAVHALLERKPDHINIDVRVDPPEGLRPSLRRREFRRHQWNSAELTIVVVFDETRTVVHKFQVEPQMGLTWFRIVNAVKRSVGIE